MAWGPLADLVLVLHFAFIAFAVFGALAWLRWRYAPLVHLPAVEWGAGIELAGGICPLTPLENALRRAAGDPGYAGGFIERYLGSIIYPAGLTPATQWLLAAGLLVVNLALYAWVLRRRRRARDLEFRSASTS
jgi:hypothetical protein